jgi:hypothetical protein
MMCNYINLDANNLSVSVCSKERERERERFNMKLQKRSVTLTDCIKPAVDTSGRPEVALSLNNRVLCLYCVPTNCFTNTKAFELPFPGYQSY